MLDVDKKGWEILRFNINTTQKSATTVGWSVLHLLLSLSAAVYPFLLIIM